MILGVLVDPTGLRMSIDNTDFAGVLLPCLSGPLCVDVGPVEAGGGDQEEDDVHHHQYHAGQ